MGNWLQKSAYAVVTALAIGPGICVCLAQQPPGDVSPPAATLDKPASEPKVITQADTVAPRITDRKLREVQFDGTPLEDAINRLRDTTASNFLINWKQIEQAGINRKAPVNLRLHDVRLSKVLEEISRQVSPDPVNRLVSVDDEGVISISTEAELSSNVVTRLYEMADLATDGAVDGAAQGLDDVADLIVNTVDVNTWEDAGGTGTIRPVYSRGRLLITQTPEVHRHIVALLRLLRRPSPQFTVELCLLQLDPSALPASLQRMLPGLDDGEGQPIGRQEKTALLRASKSTMTFPSLHAISGQAARLRSGTDVSYIARIDGNTDIAADGRTITVRPSVAPDGGPTTIAVEYKMARLEKMDQATVRPDPKSTQQASVQLPHMAVAEISATVAIEDGKSVILAVPELESPSGVKSQGATGRQTYLLLTPHQHLPAPAATAD